VNERWNAKLLDHQVYSFLKHQNFDDIKTNPLIAILVRMKSWGILIGGIEGKDWLYIIKQIIK